MRPETIHCPACHAAFSLGRDEKLINALRNLIEAASNERYQDQLSVALEEAEVLIQAIDENERWWDRFDAGEVGEVTR